MVYINHSFLIGWGPNEYTPLGTLKDFEYTNRLNEIQVPALIITSVFNQQTLTNPLNCDNMYHDHPQNTYDDILALNAILHF